MKIFSLDLEGVNKILLIYKFTNPENIPNGIKYFQYFWKEKEFELIERLENCDGGKRLIERLKKRDWKIKEIFLNIRDGNPTKYRVGVILEEDPVLEDSEMEKKILQFKEASWKYCNVYRKNGTLVLVFAHLIQKSEEKITIDID